MRVFSSGFRLPVCGVAWGADAGAEKPAGRQVPAGNNADVWRDVKSGEQNYASIRREVNVLVQRPALPRQKSMVTRRRGLAAVPQRPVTFHRRLAGGARAADLAAVYFGRGR